MLNESERWLESILRQCCSFNATGILGLWCSCVFCILIDNVSISTVAIFQVLSDLWMNESWTDLELDEHSCKVEGQFMQ